MSPKDWLDEHGDALFRFAMQCAHDVDLASDLVQETLLSAWKNHESFSDNSTVRTWLIGIVKHKWIDMQKLHLVLRMKAKLKDEGNALPQEKREKIKRVLQDFDS